MLRRLAAVAAVSFLVPTAPAHALVPQQALAYSGGYVLSEITIFAGDTLTLTNLDAQQAHDIVSLDWLNGSRRFRSDAAAVGQSVPVVGVETLPPSTYPFLCSIHEWMVGNLTVTATG